MTESKQNAVEKTMVKIILDGAHIEVESGTTILTAAVSAGIKIPTLCYYRGISPAGSCRICVVELKIQGKGRLVPSCHYAITEPVEIITRSERVIASRKMTIELLLARCPDKPALTELAKEYGVNKIRFSSDKDDCILCGLCVRVCRELMQVEALSMIGRGAGRRIATPYDEKSPVCMSCGACAFVCPTDRISIKDIYSGNVEENLSVYNENLVQSGKIILSYQQQIPKIPVIDRENCIHFQTGACGACEKVCMVGAINYEQEDREVELSVGAVVATPGYGHYDAGQKGALGFGRYANVLSNLQFERVLNASGPFGGEVRRPSDGHHPKKIAFLQCVGSRDYTEEGKPYCSTVCCMASIKEAVIAREHDSNIQPAIFYIDLRSHGKDFERYFEDAKNKYGIRFKRSSVAKIYEKPLTRNLVIKYVDETSGEIVEEEFDMVILAAGLVAQLENKDLAESLNITLNKYGFCEAHKFQLPTAEKAGIFVGGAFTEPKYIPEAVVEGSCAASGAARLLADARGTLSKKKKYPKQLDVTKLAARVGVFVCRCGRNIASTVNVPEVVAYAAKIPGVVFAAEFVYSCSQDSLEIIKQKIHEHQLNRVVVASCSPRTHEYLFAETIREAGLNRYYFELASIREHCSWVHMAEPELATQKAKELVEMMVEKVMGARPVRLKYSPVVQRGVVIGGGVSGMNAAISIAEQGFECAIIEKEGELGGFYLRHALPVLDIYPADYLKTLIESVRSNPRIAVYLNSEATELTGVVGDFKLAIRDRQTGLEGELPCGAVLVATGAEQRKPVEYGYGTDERIMTQVELEAKLADKSGIQAKVQNVVMIQCVGSREEPNMYCSRLCCSQAMMNALRIKEKNPKISVYILYRDIRTYGFREELYRRAREAGVIFLRYKLEKKPRVELTGMGLKVHVLDEISHREVNIGADLVVLSAGMAPASGNEVLSKVLRVPMNRDGFFLEAHAKIRPVDFTSEGLFLAGLAHSPQFTNECVTQAFGASIRAASILSKEKMESKAEIVEVNTARCSGCGLCVAVCPYEARVIDEETGKAVVLEVQCQGCGSCAATCPNKATGQNLFRHTQILPMLEPVGMIEE